MATESTIVCVPCGQVFSAATDDEAVRLTQDHAKRHHDTALSGEYLMQKIKHSERPDDAKRTTQNGV